MGGDREFATGKAATTPSPTIEVGKPQPPTAFSQDQHVRVHENAGEVHFHVDSEQLKAAVPVAEWYEAWAELSKKPGASFVYSDSVNGTLLNVQSALVGGGLNQPDTLDAKINVKKINVGATFAELAKFTKP